MMASPRVVICFVAVAAALLFSAKAGAGFEKGTPAPNIRAVDINGNEVNLDAIVKTEKDLVILFFFTPSTGEEMARKLYTLDQVYGDDKLEIIALGLKEDEAALREFATSLGVRYFIIHPDKLDDKTWLDRVDTLPLTMFVIPNEDKLIERVLEGGGASTASTMTKVAEYLFRQQKDLDKAAKLADEAKGAGENASSATEIKAYILTEQGKMDEAEKEFEAIDSKTGLAKVALESGDYDKAIALADEAGDSAYALTVKGQAQAQKGDIEGATETLASAPAKEGADWQKSEALNAHGRVLQESKQVDAAIANYDSAIALDPLNVVALSNEGAAYREKGDPESLAKSEAALERAGRIRNDELVGIMLQQVQSEMKRANDIERRKLIQSQIKDLAAKYKEMKDTGKASQDAWSTRPLVVAFLPSNKSTAFFERAGTDIVLQREIESKLQADGRVSVVEREMLDALLQELDLGSSDLASADTQRSLGQVLSAGMLGFLDFAQVGSDKVVYLRMVDTETTSIAINLSQAFDEKNLMGAIEAINTELLTRLTGDRELKGLVADATDDSAVIINLGSRHGVEKGQTFTVFEDGDPIEVGGRIIAYRQKPVAQLTVTSVEPEYAICSTSNKREGTLLAKEMKIKLTPN